MCIGGRIGAVLVGVSSLYAGHAGAVGYEWYTGSNANSEHRFSFGIELERVQKQKLEFEGSTGTISGSHSVLNGEVETDSSTEKLEHEIVYVRAGYAVTPNVEVLGKVGFSTTEMSQYEGEQSIGYGIGISVTPKQTGRVRMKVSADISRLVSEDDSSEVGLGFAEDDGITFSSFSGSGTAKQNIELTSISLVAAVGLDFRVVSPYFGASYSMVTGEYDLDVSGTGTLWQSPSGGGLITSSSESFSISQRQDISSESSLGAFAGISVSASDSIGMSLEARIGAQQSYVGSVSMRF